VARRHTLGWGHPAPGWGQAFPGWDPLPDTGPLPFRAVRSLARWWWPITAITGFLAVVGYVLGHDSGPGLSNRGWLTVILAAVVVLLLTAHRAGRGGPPRAPLARAVAEYAVVALLTVLLTTTGGPPPAQAPEDAAGRQPTTEQPAQRGQPAEPDRRPPPDRADTGTAADRRPGIVRVVTGVWGWLAELWHTAGELADRRSPPTSTTTPKPSAQALSAPALAPPTWRSHP
jgi:hypothetical protein